VRGEVPTKTLAAVVRQVKQKLNETPKEIATRSASEFALEALIPALPEMIGGSADLTGSNNTRTKSMRAMSASDFSGRFIHYGVREHGMAAALNGMAVHGGVIPYAGTFLVFSDYCRPAIRLAALMRRRVIYVMTHDSIGLGEDGPTHQPIEHVSSLRLIPNLDVWRPCDTTETAVAWAHGVERSDGPSLLALSRQNLAFVPRSKEQIEAIRRGAYVLADASGAKAIIIATGSEVELALKAQKLLADAGIPVRVVSMPCTNIFDRQDRDYKVSVLPADLPKVAVEAGVTALWHRYVGIEGRVIGIDRFGESAPAGALFEYFGLTADYIKQAVEELL
jgi:transketolase